MKRRLRRWAIDVAIVLTAVAAIGFWRNRGHLRGELPAATLSSLEGPPVSLRSLAGAPALVVFFAPWCGVCKATAQNVRWASGASGVRVVSIASAYDDVAAVRAYAASHETAGVLLDGDDRVTRAFGVTVYPTFAFVDARGRVTASTVGYTTTLGLLARLFVFSGVGR